MDEFIDHAFPYRNYIPVREQSNGWLSLWDANVGGVDISLIPIQEDSIINKWGNKKTLFAFPLIIHSPELSFAFGGGGNYYFLHGQDPIMHTSFTEFILIGQKLSDAVTVDRAFILFIKPMPILFLKDISEQQE